MDSPCVVCSHPYEIHAVRPCRGYDKRRHSNGDVELVACGKSWVIGRDEELGRGQICFGCGAHPDGGPEGDLAGMEEMSGIIGGGGGERAERPKRAIGKGWEYDAGNRQWFRRTERGIQYQEKVTRVTPPGGATRDALRMGGQSNYSRGIASLNPNPTSSSISSGYRRILVQPRQEEPDPEQLEAMEQQQQQQQQDVWVETYWHKNHIRFQTPDGREAKTSEEEWLMVRVDERRGFFCWVSPYSGRRFCAVELARKDDKEKDKDKGKDKKDKRDKEKKRTKK